MDIFGMTTLPMNVKYKNRKGQAILFAVVGVTIALAVGVTVASRNLSTITRVSRSDTSERAFAAAEGGIEKLLVLSGSQLDAIIGNATGSCSPVSGTLLYAGSCNIKYPKPAEDPIESAADLKVEKYRYNATYETTNYLALDIDNGSMAEVTLGDSTGKYSGNLTLCWENKAAAIYYSFNNYYATCDIRKGALRSSDNSTVFPNVNNTSGEGFTVVSTQNYGFSRCNTFTLSGAGNTFDSLRIRALYERTLVGIFASPDLPYQGYKLTSSGKITGAGEVVKKVVAYRSYSFMPGVFDAAIFNPMGPVN
jgi:hypothetical protein